MSQQPFGPRELSVPPHSSEAFLELLARDYARKCAERPKVFEAIISGHLERDLLAIFVKDMYLYWDSLYFSTAAIFLKTNDGKVREGLLRKLVEIEGRVIVNDVAPSWTAPSYEEMWLDFALAAGLSREEVSEWSTFTRTYFSISTLCMYARGWEWSWLDGLANLYAQDCFYLENLPSIIHSLRSNYGFDDRSLAFFEAVLGDARENVEFEKDAIAYWACTTERQLTAARAFRERLDIEHQVLFSLQELMETGELPFQIPKGTEIPALIGRTEN